jgi:hypothetical protein
MAMTYLPELRAIRAELIVDPSTVSQVALIMIFRADYAVRVYPSEIPELISQLESRRGVESLIIQRVNYSVRVYSNEIAGLIGQLRGIQEQLGAK